MEKLYEIHDLSASVKRESVFEALECHRNNPAYEEIAEEYDDVIDEMDSLVRPVGIIGFSALTEETATEEFKAGTSVIYGVMSIGDGVKKRSTEAFREGNYVRGMLWDAIGDEALFSLEGQLTEKLKEVCRKHGVGICRRLEAPHDISMQVQRDAWETLELEERFQIHISSGFMYDPVKTFCQVFVLSQDENEFKAEHDCRKCGNIKCRRRHVPGLEVTVKKGKEEKKIYGEEKETLMDVLLKEGYYLNSPCGGKGRCGKCGIQVIKGHVPVTEEDRTVFSEKELEEGWRLSCLLAMREDIEILFPEEEAPDYDIVSVYEGKDSQKKPEQESPEMDIAIDIGTTTLVMELRDSLGGYSIKTAASINSQRKYGGDVISRIQASVNGKKETLRELIRQDLLEGIKTLLGQGEISLEQIGRISIAGNTTMIHLLMGYDCHTLGVYPFTPVHVGFIHKKYSDIFGSPQEEREPDVWILPGISAYVGGDIVSGLFACDFDKKDEICFLVDLGTNGEMALGNKDMILVTSTAAGPAFEGGNISCGTGSVEGAIHSVNVKGNNVEIQTIGDKEPVGICGTGVLETAAELVREGIADETGCFREEYFETGFPLAKNPHRSDIVFTQKDMREVQLAKAAVRAGMETLLLRYGIEKKQVGKVYLAGGFGYGLNKEKAIEIGMLPGEFDDRIEIVGNSSLAGAVKFFREKDSIKRLEKITDISREISLSADKDFQELYVDFMMFDS